MPPCPDCGVDEVAINVPDSISAVRTFPRRFREALAGFPAEAVRTRPDPETPSALEVATSGREELELLARALPRVLDEPGTAFRSLDVAPPGGSQLDPMVDAEITLAGIEHAADVLVTRAEATPVEAWDRPFAVNGVTHPASWIMAHAAHAGAHALRDIERVGRRVGAPDDE